MTFQQTHTSLQPQSDHICQLKRGFQCYCPACILPSWSLSKPHLPPCLRSGFPFSPRCVSLPSQSVCSAYCASCESWMMPVNWWNQSLRLTQPMFTQETVQRKPSVIKPLRHLYNSLHILVYLEPVYKANIQIWEVSPRCDIVPLCTL